MMGTEQRHGATMKTKLISLAYVKMAIERGSCLQNTKAAAVSRPHGAMAGRDGEMLHGACVVFDLN